MRNNKLTAASEIGNMEKIICADCGEEITNDDFYTTRDGRIFCFNCYEYEVQYPSYCFHFGEHGQGVNVSEPSVFTELFGDENGELPEPIKKEIWHKSDAWRGYTDWELKPGYTKIADGWVTGMPDESTQRKVELADYFEQLKSGELIPPVEIWWLFGKTSNVFSTASSIVCRSGDVETLKQWLEEIDGGIEHFEEMFS